MRGEFFSFQDQTLDAHFPQAKSVSCSQRKRAHKDLNGNGGSSLGGRTSLGGSTLTTPPGQSWTSTSSASTPRTKLSFVPPQRQLKLYGNAILPEANQQMHIAIAAFIHGSALPFSMARDPNFLNIIDIARNLGPRYTPADRRMVSCNLLDSLYGTSFKGTMTTLLSKVETFGLTIYGDGATIKSVPLINILTAGPNNPFDLMDIVDCTTHLQNQGKKDALYIAQMILPLIERMENTRDIRNKKHSGIVDLVLMDGASNLSSHNRWALCRALGIAIFQGCLYAVSSLL